jgi:hypothetical protein
MDAFKSALGWTVRVLLTLLFAAVALPPGDCQAEHSATCCHRHRPFFDGSTWCAWHRTWHAYTALDRPLTPYYLPRPVDYCDYGGYANGCGEAVDGYYMMHSDGDREYNVAADCESPAALEMVHGGFERLGQIPNDLELTVGAPGAAPGR